MTRLQQVVAAVDPTNGCGPATTARSEARKPPSDEVRVGCSGGALGGIRTPNLLIRSQMLYPLSYERR
jgi:hypothetical protein